MTFLRIKIRHAQSVSRVLLSRKKSSWPFGGPFLTFFQWTENGSTKYRILYFLYFFLGGPTRCYFPCWSNKQPGLLSTSLGMYVSTDPLLSKLQQLHPLQIVGGLPVLSEHLQWGDSSGTQPWKICKKYAFFFDFFVPRKRVGLWAWDGPKWGWEVFFRLIQTLRHFGRHGL